MDVEEEKFRRIRKKRSKSKKKISRRMIKLIAHDAAVYFKCQILTDFISYC